MVDLTKFNELRQKPKMIPKKERKPRQIKEVQIPESIADIEPDPTQYSNMIDKSKVYNKVNNLRGMLGFMGLGCDNNTTSSVTKALAILKAHINDPQIWETFFRNISEMITELNHTETI